MVGMKMKKIGIVFLVIAAILMLFLAFVVAVIIHNSMGYYSLGMFSHTFYGIVIVDALLFAIGVFCLFHKK